VLDSSQVIRDFHINSGAGVCKTRDTDDLNSMPLYKFAFSSLNNKQKSL